MLDISLSILDAWFSIIRKSVNIPDKSGYCFKKTTIHFAHYVRSVAATHRPQKILSRPDLQLWYCSKENGAYTESISIGPELVQQLIPIHRDSH